MKTVFQKLKILALIAPLLTCCVTQSTPAPEAEETPSVSEDHEESTSDLGLKQEQLWSRVDELENMLIKQQEKLQVLEKEYLKQPPQRQAGWIQKAKKAEMTKKTIEVPALKESYNEFQKKSDPTQDYALKLTKAKSLFNQKVWHKALLAFSEIEREVDPKLSNGEPLYWIARCWYEMKEYRSARAYFNRYVQHHPKTTLEASARLFKQKTEERISNNTKEHAL
jgi:TolA-binding protein